MAGKKGRSGRKPKREQFGALYEATERDLHSLLPLVGPSLAHLIDGIWVEESDRHGGERVYQLPPNVKAIELLLNRTMGEGKKIIELSGKNGEPVKLQWGNDQPA